MIIRRSRRTRSWDTIIDRMEMWTVTINNDSNKMVRYKALNPSIKFMSRPNYGSFIMEPCAILYRTLCHYEVQRRTTCRSAQKICAINESYTWGLRVGTIPITLLSTEYCDEAILMVRGKRFWPFLGWVVFRLFSCRPEKIHYCKRFGTGILLEFLPCQDIFYY